MILKHKNCFSSNCIYLVIRLRLSFLKQNLEPSYKINLDFGTVLEDTTRQILGEEGAKGEVYVCVWGGGDHLIPELHKTDLDL